MATSARLGGVGPGDRLSIKSSLRGKDKLLLLTDNIRQGFWPNTGRFQRALAQANEGMAIKVQDAMVKSLNQSIRQTGRSQNVPRDHEKNALQVSLASENNRSVTASEWQVMRTGWMERSPAQAYWRQIEEGHGEELWSGLFTNNLDKFYGPWTPGGNMMRVRASGRVSVSSRENPPPGYKHGRMPQGMAHGVLMLVGPFPAYHYIEGGRDMFIQVQGKAKSLYGSALRQYGLNIKDYMRK